MLLRRRAPGIDLRPVKATKEFEHLDQGRIAVLRWLKANRVEFVLVGAVAEAVRGQTGASGPVAIVPAPYRRNLERLERALSSAHACLRVDGTGPGGETEMVETKLTAEKLARRRRWTLRCGAHDLDIEGHPQGAPAYQELLFEAGRCELVDEVSVDVASPEDIEHYAHLRRTGVSPEIRIARTAKVEQDTS